MPYGTLSAFLGNIFVSILGPFIAWVACFVFLTLSCTNSFYVLDMNSLWVYLVVNIFSHSVSCLFLLFRVSSSMQMFQVD